MEIYKSKSDRYSIPLVVKSSYKLGMHIVFIFVIGMLGAALFIPTEDVGSLIFKIICLVLDIFLVYSWTYMAILKKVRLELSEKGISFKTMFGTKKVLWEDVVDVQTYSFNSNSFIGIITKQKLEKHKETFISGLVQSLAGNYSLSIPLKTFSKVDPEKLYSTIFYLVQEKLEKKYEEEVKSEDAFDVVDIVPETVPKDRKNKPILALVLSFITSLVAGVIYGLSVHLLNINFIIIPMLGMVGIIYIYFKYYEEASFNIITRFFLGIFCAMQFFISLFISLALRNWDLANVYGIKEFCSRCITYIVKNPDEYAVYYLLSIVCFFLGVTSGYSFKFTRRIKQLFIKKRNGIYIVKDKRYIYLYLVDYARYNDKEQKFIISMDPNTCQVEKRKKNICAFYIPEELVKDIEMDTLKFEKTYLLEKIYYKLDLGSSGRDKQTYGYTSLLILNKDRQVELIQLEID